MENKKRPEKDQIGRRGESENVIDSIDDLCQVGVGRKLSGCVFRIPYSRVSCKVERGSRSHRGRASPGKHLGSLSRRRHRPSSNQATDKNPPSVDSTAGTEPVSSPSWGTKVTIVCTIGGILKWLACLPLVPYRTCYRMLEPLFLDASTP